MALVIDATPGATTSNSYATLAEADAYFEAAPGFFAVWDALTDAEKTARLIEAARAIDRLPIIGNRADPDQALRFPQTLDPTMPFDMQIAPMTVPLAVKQAQCELVRMLYNTAGAITGQAGDRDIKRVKVEGVVEVEYEAATQRTLNPLYGGGMEAVNALLGPWIGSLNAIRFIK